MVTWLKLAQKRFKFLGLLIILLISQSLAQVSALSINQRQTLESGAYYFNTEDTPIGCSGCCGSGDAGSTYTSASGSGGAETVWGYLTQTRGLSAIAAAGLGGSFQQESGFSPTATNSAGYYGLVQWNPGSGGRLERLQNFAAADPQGRSYSDLGLQLDFMWKELTGDYKSTLAKLSSSDLVLGTPAGSSSPQANDSVYIAAKEYEGATAPDQKFGVQNYDDRLRYATELMSKFGSNAAGGSTNTSSCASSSGQVVGNLSLPVDRKWYDQHPEWFTKPHHTNGGTPDIAADIPVPLGTAVYSMTDGKVAEGPVGGECGEGIQINAGGGIMFVYCHGSDGGSVEGARVGDQVHAGQLIMHSASTGFSTGPHLHVGIMVNGVFHCPQTLFVGIAQSNPPDIASLPTSGCSQGTL
jgi:murein DD-endopeptidase MepM/ murein hydrolase activator NlpD